MILELEEEALVSGRVGGFSSASGGPRLCAWDASVLF